MGRRRQGTGSGAMGCGRLEGGQPGGGDGEGGATEREGKEVGKGRGWGRGDREGARGVGISQMDMMECLGGHRLQG